MIIRLSFNLVVLSFIMLLLPSCAWRLPDHAFVPDDAMFVARSPSQGVDTRGNCCIGYGEKYVLAQSPDSVVDFYKDHAFECRPYNDRRFEFETDIWRCEGTLDGGSSMLALIMSQEGIQADLERININSDIRRFTILMGHLPLINTPADISDDTMIIADVEIEDG
ncbi:MAG: hypothetical protein HC876_16730 [Chloroflexaceae bacterium]|nr:hypothetical protein [Chloroflexaceae bacterium]NJO07026.1 hypothetical protein [Chloroflexaceae bacterium]